MSATSFSLEQYNIHPQTIIRKLKRAISTIDDYDLPDDPGLREISAALSQWLSKNLVTK